MKSEPEVLVLPHLVLVHDQLNRRVSRLAGKAMSGFHVTLTHRVRSSAAESSCSAHPVPHQEKEPAGSILRHISSIP